MAIIFPKGIYSEGQGIFDPMPYIKYLDAKKKAKDEAYTKYYDDLNKQINPAGVRSQDLVNPEDVTINGQVVAKKGEGIVDDIKKWQEYGVQNRNEISKGGMARMQFEGMQREILGRIQQSKNNVKFDNELQKAQFDGGYDPNDDDMKAQSRVSYSIYDPRHYKEHFNNPNYTDKRGTEFNWGDISHSVSTFDPTERDKLLDFGIGDNKREPTGETKIIGGQRFNTYAYNDNVLKAGADRVMAEIQDKPIDMVHKRGRKTYNSLKDNDPYWLAKADPIFQKYYGKPIETAKEAAAADFLLKYSEPVQKDEGAVKAPRLSKGSGGSKAIIWNAYGELVPKLQKEEGNFIKGDSGQIYHPINQLGSSYYNLFIDQLKHMEEQNKTVYPISQTYVTLEPDGTLGLYLVTGNKTKTLITAVDERGLNRLANPGEKGRTGVEESLRKKGGTKTAPAKTIIPSAATPKKIKGSTQKLYKIKNKNGSRS